MDQQTEASRIAARIRERRTERPPLSETATALFATITPEQVAETIAAMPEANRERIFRQFPDLKP